MVSNDYYKSKIALNEKKAKRLQLDPKQWELNDELMSELGLSLEAVKSNPEIARRLIFREVGY